MCLQFCLFSLIAHRYIYECRIRVEDSVAHIGPIAVHKEHQGKGISKLLLDFAESFAETSEIEVVSCSKLFPMYENRGYKTKCRIPITNYIPPQHLLRFDLDFVVMQKSSKTN